MIKYRKKLAAIEAIQWTGENWLEIAEFMGGSVVLNTLSSVIVDTLDGFEMHAEPYDWIVCDNNGQFSAVEARMFSELYEAA